MTANEALKVEIDERMRRNPENTRILIRKIKDSCCISTAILSNWKTGKTKIPHLSRREITRILNVDLFENVTD